MSNQYAIQLTLTLCNMSTVLQHNWKKEKATLITGKFRKSLCMPRERYRLEKDQRDPKFIPQSDPGQEDGLQQSRTHAYTHTHTNWKQERIWSFLPGDRGQSNFYSYHIIWFKFPVFKNNKTTGHQKQSVALTQRKNIN